MPNSYFRFKRFTIWQEDCAMKVGTDGVLLGAWTPVDGATRILDVGTGTGLLALMLAQRCDAPIDALEIDERACGQAQRNVKASPWPGQIRVVCAALQAFALLPQAPYDLLISNPPFFAQSSKNPDAARATARHSESLRQEELLEAALRLLLPTGRLSVIYPLEEAQRFVEKAHSLGFFLHRKMAVRPRADRPVKRWMMSFSRTDAPQAIEEELVIETAQRHVYTAAYEALTRDYYLRF